VTKSKPRGLETAGAALWASVVDVYDLEQHELLLLEQAARTADVVARLVAHVGAEVVDEKGRVRPELIEARQQRITLARLLAALRVPLGEEGKDGAKHAAPRLQRRSGARGVYALPSVS
jgi:hypothetical protein